MTDKLSRRQLRRIAHFFREKEERALSRPGKFPHRSPSGDARRRESVVRLLAKKVDQIVVVSSFVMPALRTGLIDRFIVMAGVEKVDPVIVLNKADLLESREVGEEVLALYRSLGYCAFITSTVGGEGIDVLKDILQGKTSLLAGHSGVGKSSLLNAVQSGLSEKAEVSEVSRATEKGRHTTTTVRLYRLDDETTVFDLPGVKLASLYDIDGVEIGKYFPEFFAPSRLCRYRDCLHIREDECGVKAALEEGSVSRQRYESYCRMVTNPQAQP